MKNLTLLFVVTLLLAACGQRQQADQVDENTQEATEMSTIQFNVVGMTCTGCEATINAAVSSLDGVADVVSSHIDSLTTVQFDPGKVSVEQLQEAIAGKGYSVTGFTFPEKDFAEPTE